MFARIRVHAEGQPGIRVTNAEYFSSTHWRFKNLCELSLPIVASFVQRGFWGAKH